MEKLRRLRTERGLSQARLAARAELDPSTVNQIERGAREASPATLRKLAKALDVSVAEVLEDVSPKVSGRSSHEPSFNDVLEEERLSKLPEVLGKYITARIERHEAEVEAPDSPHFRTATSATLWLAGVEEELTTWADWAVNEVSHIMPTPRTGAAFTDVLGGIANVLEVMGVMFAFDGVKREAEERIRAMKDMPDALSARRLEKASAEAQASMERLQDLGKAANG